MLGFKERSMKQLLEKGLNVPDYIVPKTLIELIEYAEENNKCTIRFDSMEKIDNLPFYVFEKEDLESCVCIWEEAKDMGCNLIVANAHMHENKMLYNAVAEIHRNKDFIVDVGYRTETLREMYKRPVCTIQGNMLGKYEARNTKGVSVNRVIDSVFELYNKGLTDCIVEYTKYSENVGKLNEDIICWQLTTNYLRKG